MTPETEKGNKYVLVAADCFTKWVEVYGIPNQEAVTVAVKLVDEMFCRFSPPEQACPAISDIHTRLYIENACKVFDCF